MTLNGTYGGDRSYDVTLGAFQVPSAGAFRERRTSCDGFSPGRFRRGRDAGFRRQAIALLTFSAQLRRTVKFVSKTRESVVAV